MHRRFYIAGPMSGLPGFNYSAFNDAEEQLQERFSSDALTVINPASNHGGDTTLDRWQYMSKTLDQINSLARLHNSVRDQNCAVVVLPGWSESKGACLEVMAADQLGLPIYGLSCIIGAHNSETCNIFPYEPPRPCGVPLLAEWEKRVMDTPPPPEKDFPVLSGTGTLASRASILDEAKRLVNGDRNNQYGPPGKDFNRIAGALTSLGYGKEDANGEMDVLQDHDVAIMMILLKLSRLMWSPGKADSWLDAAGYAACGAEVARAEH